MTRRVAVVSVLFVVAFAGADRACRGAAVHTDVPTFVSNMLPDYYMEPFDWCVYGNYQQWTWDSPVVNGYSYTMSTGPAGASYLWSNNGAMSTEYALDLLHVAFTGKPVTAVGGLLFGSDINGNWVPAGVTIDLSDGTHYVYNNTSPNNFRGFITDVPIVSMTIDCVDPGPPYYWSTVDNFYVGTVIPEPSSILVWGLLATVGITVAWYRRRKAA